jgi:Holliday junction DNA helicase RuvA
MIGRLTGTLIEKNALDVLLDVQGVGYQVHMPLTSLAQLPDVGVQVHVHTHFVVREDAQILYGFTSTTDRSLFCQLIKINGVGPKLAQGILSGLTGQALVQCILDQDLARLVKVQGVGKKTAERLLIELKDKLNHFVALQPQANASGMPATSAPETQQDYVEDDAIAALLTLGYKSALAKKMVEKSYQEGMTSADLIKTALQTVAV